MTHADNPSKVGALKLLHRPAIPGSRTHVLFNNEITSMRRVNHPNVVKIIESGTLSHDRCYFVMELLHGKTLAQLIEQRLKLPISETLGVGLQIAKAIQSAHRTGVIHRDLKPSNIMVIDQDDGEPIIKVIDFGIAKIVSEESSSRKFTPTGELRGSLPYMAPEQFSAPHGIDKKIDTYSLGIILYQCVTGALPFTAKSDAEWQKQKVENLITPPRNAPNDFSDLILRMICKDRSKRPSMSTVVKTIERCITNLQSHNETRSSLQTPGDKSAKTIDGSRKYQSASIMSALSILAIGVLNYTNRSKKDIYIHQSEMSKSESSSSINRYRDSVSKDVGLLNTSSRNAANFINAENRPDRIVDMTGFVEPMNRSIRGDSLNSLMSDLESIESMEHFIGLRKMDLPQESKEVVSVDVEIDGDLRGIQYGEFEVLTDDNQVRPCGRANRDELTKSWPCSFPIDAGRAAQYIRFRGYVGDACEIAMGQTRRLSPSDHGNVVHLTLRFKPRLILSARLINSTTMATPKLFDSRDVVALDFSVQNRKQPEAGFAPVQESCHSGVGEYYVEPGADVEVITKGIDGSIFDGWADAQCPKAGKCPSRRVLDHVMDDTRLESRYLSWLCTSPESFCQMSPLPERYKSVLDGRSAMSSMAIDNNNLWIVGHNWTPVEYNKTVQGRQGIILNWNGNEWSEYFIEKRLWDVAGYVTDAVDPSLRKSDIYAIGDEGIYHLVDNTFIKEATLSGTGIFASHDVGAWAVGKSVEGKVRLLHRNRFGEWKPMAEELLANESRSLHSVAGNRDRVFASGKNGLLIEITLSDLQAHVIAAPEDIREDSRFYAQVINDRSDLFLLSSYLGDKRFPKIVSYDSRRLSFNSIDIPLSSLFGAWLNPNSANRNEIWITGAYAPIWRCGFPSVMARACESVRHNVPESASLRGFAGTSLENLWAIGYDRVSSQIRLARYRSR